MRPAPFISQRRHLPWRRQSIAGSLARWQAENEEVPLYQSPVRLLVLLAVSIFFGETCVMLLLHLFPAPHPITEALLDAGMLLIVVSPTLYFFMFRPFMNQLQRQKQSEEEIRTLSRRLIVAGEEERRRVAMDLHDHFGQVLTGLHLRLQQLSEMQTELGSKGREQCLEMSARVRELGEETRRYASCLRPAIIDDLGLVPALEWLVAEQQRHHPEPRIELRILGVNQQPPGPIAEAIFRISQESFSNIIKHAEAQRVEVTLLYRPPKLILTIRDDGRGFVLPTTGHQGIGLWSMRERAVLAGGKLSVSSMPGSGTTVRVELPMAKDA